MDIEYSIRRFARFCGLDLKRYRQSDTAYGQLCKMLSKHRVSVILDVGAYSGQFATSLRDAGYGGEIVSFEPLSQARVQLSTKAEKDSNWTIAPAAAIGDEDGEIDIQISGNSVSSSILDMHDTHRKAAPDSRYIGSERVPLRRLDSVANSYLDDDSIVFLKVDTQGYEPQVWRGAEGLRKAIVGVQMELSLVPLYQGQILYEEMIKQLKSNGYELWGIYPAFWDPSSGRQLQIDAVFFRHPPD